MTLPCILSLDTSTRRRRRTTPVKHCLCVPVAKYFNLQRPRVVRAWKCGRSGEPIRRGPCIIVQFPPGISHTSGIPYPYGVSMCIWDIYLGHQCPFGMPIRDKNLDIHGVCPFWLSDLSEMSIWGMRISQIDVYHISQREVHILDGCPYPRLNSRVDFHIQGEDPTIVQGRAFVQFSIVQRHGNNVQFTACIASEL